MNVYITTLDRETESDLKVILEMLGKDKGDIKFSYLQIRKNTEYNKKYTKLSRLSLDEINEIVNDIKTATKTHNEYVILLTGKGLDIPVPDDLFGKDWNSVFLHKNIAINTSRWDELTEDRSYLAVAHQIIENIFQCLSHININGEHRLLEIHTDSKGCINDYCKNFNEITAKIMSGYICKNCQERFLDFESEKDLIQIKRILTRIRNRITDNFEFDINSDRKIKINKYGVITLGGCKLDFGRSKTVRHSYLFFLINYNKDITTDDLRHNEEVRQKFLELSKLDDLNFNSFMMDNYIDNISTHQTRTRKFILNSLINENQFEIFSIKGRSEKDINDPTKKKYSYQIQVNDENDISIDPSLLKFRLN